MELAVATAGGQRAGGDSSVVVIRVTLAPYENSVVAFIVSATVSAHRCVALIVTMTLGASNVAVLAVLTTAQQKYESVSCVRMWSCVV